MTDRDYKWQTQLDVGARGEAVVEQWLKQQGYYVTDLRGSPRWRERDIDFGLWTDELIEALLVEAKTDAYDNDSLFLELYAGNGRKPGALFKSRADVWYYYKAASGYVVEFSPAEAAAAVARLDIHEHLKPVMNRDENGKKRIAAWGVLVTLAWIRELSSTKVHQLVQEIRDEKGAPE